MVYSFCPKCGAALERRSLKAGEPDRLVCTGCGFIFYIDPKVAVGTIIPTDDGIVLIKRGIEPAYGKWVFPGGWWIVVNVSRTRRSGRRGKRRVSTSA